MGVKYYCEICEEEFDKQDLYNNIIPGIITVNSGKNNTQLGVIHVSKEELPEAFKKRIESGVGFGQVKPEMDISVTGSIIPREDSLSGKKNIQYKYISENPKISQIVFRLVSLTPKGEVIYNYTLPRDDERVKDFVEKIEDKVKNKCEDRSKIDESIEEKKDEPRGTAFS